MSKYNAYNNELIWYIEAIVDFPISIKDIVGDVLNFNSPVDILDENLTFEAKTALGIMTIKVAKSSTENILIFSRIIGGAIYEEYTLELNEISSNLLVYGRILEGRENGVIITNIIRAYDYCNNEDNDKRLVSSEETRAVYGKHAIERFFYKINFSKCNFEEEFEILKILGDFARVRGIKPLLKTVIKFDIPEYIGKFISRGIFINAKSVLINGEEQSGYFKDICGEKTLERINDLLHGNITLRCVDDLKRMLDLAKENYNNYYFPLYGFNLLSDYKVREEDEDLGGYLYGLEEKLIGPSKVILEKEYYEYLKELIFDTFDIELDIPMRTDEILKELRHNYKGDNNGKR